MTNSYPTRLRRDYARTIVSNCPPQLATDIALTGSVARAWATPQSDIEINFWQDHIPPVSQRIDWLRALGIQALTLQDDIRSDESHWLYGTYHDIDIELGWQTISSLDRILAQIIAAQTTDHKQLRLAELIVTAYPLRASQHVARWQDQLSHYPPKLAHRLITETLTHWVGQTWLQERLSAYDPQTDLHAIWRLLFAINHQWEINWKHALRALPQLSTHPQEMAHRIQKMKTQTQTDSLQTVIALSIETLDIIAAIPDYRALAYVTQQRLSHFSQQLSSGMFTK